MSWLRKYEDYYDDLSDHSDLSDCSDISETTHMRNLEKETASERLDFLKGLIGDPLRMVVDSYTDRYGITLPDYNDLQWGSTQYDGSYLLFYTMKGFKDAGLDPIQLISKEIIEAMPEPLLSVKETLTAVKIFRETTMKEFWDEDSEEEDDRWKGMNAETDENLDNLFICLQNQAMDLWGASDDVAEIVFGKEYVKKLPYKDHEKKMIWGGFHPCDGYTALDCYLLYAVGYISDIQTAFCGFST